MPEEVPVRLARLEADVASWQRQMDAFGPLARQFIETTVKLDGFSEELNDFKGWIGAVEKRINTRIDQVATDVREFRDTCAKDNEALRQEMKVRDEQLAARDERRAATRTKFILAIVAGCATILASLAAAALTVLAHT